MTASDQAENGTAGTYVYGIVPADVEVEDHAEGIGDPPAKVEMIREREIAALVSSIPTDHPLGKPEDFQAHARLLDGTAGVAPVLPFRFGAVMTDAKAVTEELLRDNYDQLAQALRELEGHAEYIVKGRYDEKAILSEVVSENDRARELLEDIRGKPEDATRNSRMELGEMVSAAIESKRQADTQAVVDVVSDIAKHVNIRPPTHELDALQVAALVELERQSDLEAALHELAENWQGRTELRLLGPLAAYDFVVSPEPGG